MDDLSFSVRELVQGDVTLVADYWSQAEPDYLIGLGVDLSKLPSRDDFFKMLTEQLKLPLKLRQSLKLFFDRLELQDLYCEPFALNPAPNAVLAKVGFTFVKKYVTVPGLINFEQEVNRWHMSREHFAKVVT